MADDVERTLTSLEQRLRALQDELDTEAAAEPPEPPAPAPSGAAPTGRAAPPERPAAPAERAAAPQRPAAPAAADPLVRFDAELHRLLDLWHETVSQLRGEAFTFSGDVALEVQADFEGLCALDRALRAIPGVVSVTLRAYAAGHGALDLVLDREIALIAALRRTLSFSVESAGSGRLGIAVLS